MAQIPAIRRQNGDSIPYTPAGATNVGDVVVLGTKVLVANDAIPAGTPGALDTMGVYQVPKDASVFAAGDPVYWNAAGNPVGGTAGSGAATSTAAGAKLMGWAAAAQLTGDATVNALLRN